MNYTEIACSMQGKVNCGPCQSEVKHQRVSCSLQRGKGQLRKRLLSICPCQKADASASSGRSGCTEDTRGQATATWGCRIWDGGWGTPLLEGATGGAVLGLLLQTALKATAAQRSCPPVPLQERASKGWDKNRVLFFFFFFKLSPIFPTCFKSSKAWAKGEPFQSCLMASRHAYEELENLYMELYVFGRGLGRHPVCRQLTTTRTVAVNWKAACPPISNAQYDLLPE